jgi:hypothetical protein
MADMKTNKLAIGINLPSGSKAHAGWRACPCAQDIFGQFGISATKNFGKPQLQQPQIKQASGEPGTHSEATARALHGPDTANRDLVIYNLDSMEKFEAGRDHPGKPRCILCFAATASSHALNERAQQTLKSTGEE